VLLDVSTDRPTNTVVVVMSVRDTHPHPSPSSRRHNSMITHKHSTSTVVTYFYIVECCLFPLPVHVLHAALSRVLSLFYSLVFLVVVVVVVVVVILSLYIVRNKKSLLRTKNANERLDTAELSREADAMR